MPAARSRNKRTKAEVMAEESAGSDSGVAQEPEQAKQQEEDEEGDGDGDEKGSPPWKRRKAEGSTSNEGSSATQHGGFEKSTFNPKVKGVTPLQQLMNALKEQGERKNKAEKGENVVFWMRMHDLRIEDSRALAHASALAQERNGHLIVLHVLSPEDFRAHDRSSRRIDFVLRTLKDIKKQLESLHIPLVVFTHEPRVEIPSKVLELCKEWNATDLCGNIELEVDELWRDAEVVKTGAEKGVHATFMHDAYVVPPDTLKTKDGRPYSVFSPWNRSWTAKLKEDPSLLEASPDPSANEKSVVSDPKLQGLFNKSGDSYGIPSHVPGFECKDAEYMAKIWPVGDHAASRVLDNFMKGEGGQTVLDSPATEDDDKKVGTKSKESRINRYSLGRNLVNENGTSRISPYLAAGLVSPRECLRRTKALTKNKLEVGRDSGPAMWNTEIAFRDFYGHVLAAWPRVCMNRAFLTKYEQVVWEDDSESLAAWKEGRTGYPIVDAAQRQCNKQGYVHNRARMISAMFLTKHLMQNWQLGERHFMLNFVDGDFASNNGGWQWSASTGTDPQPYFRIFNPLAQSEKSDPDGEYIRHWVPELRTVKGKAIHAPYERLSAEEFKKLGYPKPIVDHSEARQRALRRYKNPGEK